MSPSTPTDSDENPQTQHNLLTKLLRCIGLSVLSVACVAFLHSQGQQYWEARWIQDDSYISFRFAKNLIRGNGLVYNPGEHVEGFTNFTWVMISAIPQALGNEDPIDFMHWCSLLLWIGTFITLWILSWRTIPFGAWISPFVMAALSLNYSFNQWFFSGMETPLVTFLVSLLVLIGSLATGKRELVLLSVLASLLLMSRMDAIFFVAPTLGIVCLRLLVRRGERPSGAVWCVVAPFLLLYGGYTAWRVLYFGQFFPNTYYAKLGHLSFYERGLSYVKTLFLAYPYLGLAGLGVVSLLTKQSHECKRLVLLSLGGILLTLFYLVRLGGDFMEWRFVTPLFGIAYVLAFVGFAIVASVIASLTSSSAVVRARVAFLLALVASSTALYMLYSRRDALRQRSLAFIMDGQENIPSLRKYADAPFLWREVGHVLRALIPPDVVYASSAAGMIPFFSEHHVIDTIGLTDRQIAMKKLDLVDAGRQRVGHEFVESSQDYLRSRGVDFILDWPGVEPRPVVGAYCLEPVGKEEIVSLRVNERSWVDLIALDRSNAVWSRLREDDRIEFYSERSKGILTVPLARVSNRVPDDTNWNDPLCVTISSELRVTLPAPKTIESLEVSVDHNDRYAVLLVRDKQVLSETQLEPYPNPLRGGVKNRLIKLPEPIGGITSILVRPSDADWNYGLCHLILNEVAVHPHAETSGSDKSVQ